MINVDFFSKSEILWRKHIRIDSLAFSIFSISKKQILLSSDIEFAVVGFEKYQISIKSRTH